MLIVMMIIGILATIMLVNLKPNNVRIEAIQKNGLNILAEINFATMSILAKSSNDMTMTNLIALDGTSFSITDSGANAKLIALYKKNLLSIRKTSIPASYLSSYLLTDTNSNIKIDSSNAQVSTFSQYFQLRNKTFFALKLNGNCTTTEDIIYDPAKPTAHAASNVCGMIFYDVNSEEGPNTLGIDQYIIPIGKEGSKSPTCQVGERFVNGKCEFNPESSEYCNKDTYNYTCTFSSDSYPTINGYSSVSMYYEYYKSSDGSLNDKQYIFPSGSYATINGYPNVEHYIETYDSEGNIIKHDYTFPSSLHVTIDGCTNVHYYNEEYNSDGTINKRYATMDNGTAAGYSNVTNFYKYYNSDGSIAKCTVIYSGTTKDISCP